MSEISIKILGINPEKKKEVYLRIILNKKFKLAVKKIRAMFDIPDREDMTDKEIIDFMEDIKIIKESEKLRKSFNLPKTWDDIVLEYVISDEFVHDEDPDGIYLETRTNENEVEKEFYLRIFPHTSIKDIKDVWFLVQKELNKSKIKTKKKKYKKFNRDIEIYFLHKSGKKVNEILRIIKDKFPKEKELDPGNIKVIIQNFKKIEENN